MSGRDEYMAHMKGFAAGAGIKAYQLPEKKEDTYAYQVGYMAGKEKYRQESKAASDLYNYKPLVIRGIGAKMTTNRNEGKKLVLCAKCKVSYQKSIDEGSGLFASCKECIMRNYPVEGENLTQTQDKAYDNGFKYGELAGYDRALSDVLKHFSYQYALTGPVYKDLDAIAEKLRGENGGEK